MGETPVQELGQPAKAVERLVVLDAGALIKLQRWDHLGDKFLVTHEVLKEVRDKRARMNLGLVPVELRPNTPTEQDYKFVREFAKQTGDLGFLSLNDLGVIALAYRVHREELGVEKLRKTPQQMDRSAQPAPPLAWAPSLQPMAATAATADPAAPPAVAPAGYPPSAPDAASPAKAEAPAASPAETPAAEDAEEAVEDAEDAEAEEEDSDEGEWVTKENIHRFGRVAADLEATRIAVATADYSVQNVLLQIGIPVVSFDGYRIRSVKLWAKTCRGCFHFTRDSEKLFCPKCGNDTLDRVSFTIEDGVPVLHDHRRRAAKKKGTIFSIPKPKTGRDAKNDLLLCEDQMMMGSRQRDLKHAQKVFERERAAIDPFNPDVLYDSTSWSGSGKRNGFAAGCPMPVVGTGRKNPNANNFKFKKTRK